MSAERNDRSLRRIPKRPCTNSHQRPCGAFAGMKRHLLSDEVFDQQTTSILSALLTIEPLSVSRSVAQALRAHRLLLQFSPRPQSLAVERRRFEVACANLVRTRIGLRAGCPLRSGPPACADSGRALGRPGRVFDG